jgi:hypothetical protein
MVRTPPTFKLKTGVGIFTPDRRAATRDGGDVVPGQWCLRRLACWLDSPSPVQPSSRPDSTKMVKL